jgi:hypothetical protein
LIPALSGVKLASILPAIGRLWIESESLH